MQETGTLMLYTDCTHPGKSWNFKLELFLENETSLEKSDILKHTKHTGILLFFGVPLTVIDSFTFFSC